MANSKLVSLKEYAKLCDVELKTIKYRIDQGYITTTKVQQFDTTIEVINTDLYPPSRIRARKK